MDLSRILFLVIYVECLFQVVSSQSCPCSYCQNNQANCANFAYRSVPGVFPPNTTVINMQINKIKSIQASDFGDLAKLVLLRLDQNELTEIKPRTFSRMVSLNELVLSRNKISSLPDDLFHKDAPLLKGIKLEDNNLKTFPLGLLLNNMKIINVQRNPIVCDCSSVIPPHLKTKVVGKCDLPLTLKGRDINSITSGEVNCTTCDEIECGKGVCISPNNASSPCKCFEGYYGKYCTEKVTTPSTASRQTVTPTGKKETTAETTTHRSTTKTVTTTTTTTTTTSTTTTTTSTTETTTTTETITTVTPKTSTTTTSTKTNTAKIATTTKSSASTTSKTGTASVYSKTSTIPSTTVSEFTGTTAVITNINNLNKNGTNPNFLKTTTVPTSTTTVSKHDERTSSPVTNQTTAPRASFFAQINGTCKEISDCRLLAESVVSKLRNTPRKLTSRDIHSIAKLIFTLVRMSKGDLNDIEEIYPLCVKLTNILMDMDDDLLIEAQTKYNSSRQVLNSLDEIARKSWLYLAKNNKLDYELKSKNLAFRVSVPVLRNASSVVVYAGTGVNGSYVQISTSHAFTNTSYQSMMTIPASIIPRDDNYITSINYQTNALFLHAQLKRQLNHRNIFSVSVGRKPLTGLKDKVTLRFYRNNSTHEIDKKEVCKFWQFVSGMNGNHGFWSTQGCQNIESNNEYVTCECDHLTNFALIVNTDQDPYNPPALQVISYVGCGVSVVALSCTVIIYAFFSKVNKKLAPKLLLCLSSSLILLLVVFMVGAEQTENKTVCFVFAMFIHYFTLSTFCWMACEGFNLYRNFITVFKRQQEKAILLRMSVFSWGMPLLIVSVTVTIASEDYSNGEKCIVVGNSFYFSLLLPIILIVCGNWLILIMSLKGMKQAKILRRTRRKNENRMQLLRGVVCATILGITWTFAVLAIGELKEVFQWLFCIFNSLQGFFIFMLFVVNNTEVRNELTRFIKGKSSRKDALNELSIIAKPTVTRSSDF